jgi:hypothetical protein
LLGHGAGLVQQVFIALVIQLGVAERSFVLEFLSLRLAESHFIGTRVNDGKQLAFSDVLSFLEIDLNQLSVHAAFHVHRI